MASNNNNHNSGTNSPPRELPTFGVINTSFGGFYTVGALRPVVCRIICHYVPAGKKECKDQVGGTVGYLINHKLSASLSFP